MISHAFNLPNIKWRKRGNLRILQDHKHRSAYEGDPKINDPSNSVHERDLSNKVGFYFEVPVQKSQRETLKKRSACFSSEGCCQLLAYSQHCLLGRPPQPRSKHQIIPTIGNFSRTHR